MEFPEAVMAEIGLLDQELRLGFVKRRGHCEVIPTGNHGRKDDHQQQAHGQPELSDAPAPRDVALDAIDLGRALFFCQRLSRRQVRSTGRDFHRADLAQLLPAAWRRGLSPQRQLIA